MTENVEEHLDRIKDAVERIITKISNESQPNEDYKQMNEMDNVKTPNPNENYDIKF
jgi:hypothetical protein